MKDMVMSGVIFIHDVNEKCIFIVFSELFIFLERVLLLKEYCMQIINEYREHFAEFILKS